LAGTPTVSGSADGTGSAARFSHPYAVAVDGSGNVYVADTYNFTVRKITPAGAVRRWRDSLETPRLLTERAVALVSVIGVDSAEPSAVKKFGGLEKFSGTSSRISGNG